MTNVEIESGVPCGSLPRAENVQPELLEEYGQELDQVVLKTGDHGVSKVRVDGEVVFDKEPDEYDRRAIVDRVLDRVRTSA